MYRKGKLVGTMREIARLVGDDSGSIRVIEHATSDPKAGPVDLDETHTYGPGGVSRHEEEVLRWKGGTSRYAADFAAKTVRVHYTLPHSRGSYEMDIPSGPPCGIATPRMLAGLVRGGAPIARTTFYLRTGGWNTSRVMLAGHEDGNVVVQRIARSGSRERIVLDADLHMRSIAQSDGYVYVRTASRKI